jgi:hypothetical protein
MRTLERRSPAYIVALLVAALLVPSTPAAAQELEGAAGAALGVGAGTLVTLAIITGKARAGDYVHSPHDVNWELIPIVGGGAVGGLLGYNQPERLWRSVYWGVGGFAGGLVVGATLGQVIWQSEEGAWAGGIIGSAAGMLAGWAIGASTWEGEGEGTPAPVAAVRIPLP